MTPPQHPALAVPPPAGPVRAVAVLLHGGRARSTAPVRARQLAVVRMLPFDRALRQAGAAHGLAVARLRYLVRGWNGPQRSPVPDAQWALDTLSERYPGAPVALIGHSMGGRTALYVADDPAVEVVVGLAPWIEDGDPVDTLLGRRVLLAHGTHDRMTSASATARYAELAGRVATSVSFVSVDSASHAMLRRAEVWHRLTAEFVAGALFGEPVARDGNVTVKGTSGDATTNVVLKALAGEASLVV